MFVRRTTEFFGAVVITLLFLAAPAARGQQADRKVLDQPVSSFAMRGRIDEILEQLSHKYVVPVGLKEVADGPERMGEPITISVRSGNVRSVLNRIVAADPRYKWEETSGVINVMPKEDSDDLLSTMVNDFQINGQSRMNLKQAIFDLPEVKSKLESMGVRPLNAELITAASKDAFSIPPAVLTNVTLRDVLNHIIKHSSSHYWVVSRFGERKDLVIIKF